MLKFLSFVCILSLLGVIACSGSSTSVADCRARLTIGMTKSEVRASCGSPALSAKIGDPSGRHGGKVEHDHYFYTDSRFYHSANNDSWRNNVLVRFKNGRVFFWSLDELAYRDTKRRPAPPTGPPTDSPSPNSGTRN